MPPAVMPSSADLPDGLCAGFVTEALGRGLPAHDIMRQTGHTDPRTLEVYARHRAPHLANAAMNLGL